MNSLKEKNILKKYDILLSISLIMLAIGNIIVRSLKLEISLAIYNLIVTSIVPLFFILTSKIRINKKILLPTIIIIVCAMLNFITAFNNLNTKGKLEELTSIIMITINFLMIYGILCSNKEFSKEYNFKYIYTSIIVVAIIYCIYNLISNAYQIQYFSNVNHRNLINFSSFFPNRNNFALFLFFSILASFFIKQNKVNSKLITFIQGLLLFNLMLTLSRSGVLSIAVYIFSYLMLTRKKRKYIVLITLILLSVIIFNPFNIRNIINSFLVREDAGTSGRVDIWIESLELFSKSPIMGYGEIWSGELLKQNSISSSCHNFYIELLISYGIIGFFSFMYLIYDIIKKDIYIYKKQNKIGAICISTMIALLTYSITETMNFFSFGLIQLMTTYFGFTIPIYYYNKIKGENNE